MERVRGERERREGERGSKYEIVTLLWSVHVERERGERGSK